jgi:cyclopropane-fatty-acyl-phospholipid synthase
MVPSSTEALNALKQKTATIDWQGVPAGLRQSLKVLNNNWQNGSLDIIFPNEKLFAIKGSEPGPHGILKINDFKMLRRVLTAGDIGFCDGYVAGEWETPDLAELLEAFVLNIERLKSFFIGNPIAQIINRISHFMNRNTKSGSKRNIFAHYDLGNAFYTQWLDATMTYSSALYKSKSDSLEAAQTAKYASLARLVDLKKDQHVLEIGCGWGGFAEYAASIIGAKATCITISQAQADYATERMERLGLKDRVEIKLMDYRDLKGQYDAIVSIEMFEAVGEDFWNIYFEQLKSCLKPGGKAGLQIITIRDDLFEDYRTRPDFIQKYIFPGGMLPPLSRLKSLSKAMQFKVLSDMDFGADYAQTLKLWGQRFDTAWKEGRITGFDDAFRKLWLFYLAYCEAGFRSGRTSVVHFGVEKPT